MTKHISEQDRQIIKEFTALTEIGKLRWVDETLDKQCFTARQFGYKLTLQGHGPATLIFEEYCDNPRRVVQDSSVFPLLEAAEIQYLDRAARERYLDREFEQKKRKTASRGR